MPSRPDSDYDSLAKSFAELRDMAAEFGQSEQPSSYFEGEYREAVRKIQLTNLPSEKKRLFELAFSNFTRALRGASPSPQLLREASVFIAAQKTAFAKSHGVTFDGAKGADSREALAVEVFVACREFDPNANDARYTSDDGSYIASHAEVEAYDAYFYGQASKGQGARTHTNDAKQLVDSDHGQSVAEVTMTRTIKKLLRGHGVLGKKKPPGRTPKSRK